ncbi:MAG: hypothetical protein AAB971_03155 [Patescibacteria group bacterium]
MKTKSRAKIFLASLLAVVTLVGSPLAVYAGYAPSGRATFQCVTPSNCPGANYVTFNSFTNAPNYGDERAFFDGKDAGVSASGGYQDGISVHDGQRIVLRTYIHNNANPNAIGEAAATAKNTRMQVLLPTSKKTNNTAASQVTADNSNPGTVSDTVDFTGGNPFTVAFDTSAPVQITYRPNGTGDFVTRTVPGAAFANNHTLNANFGDWKGCFNYGALVTTTIVVKMDSTPSPKVPAYTCDAFNITADINRSVKVSTFATTATNGAVFKNAVLNWGDNSTELTTNNVVGQTHQYSADGTYTITATAHFTVDGKDVTASGPNCAKSVTFTSNTPPKVTPPSPTPTQLVNTGAGSVASIFAAVTAAGAVAYRIVLTRRLSRQ